LILSLLSLCWAAEPAPGADLAVHVIDGITLAHDLTLGSAGAAPRTLLAFAPKPGLSQDHVVTSTQTMKLQMKGPDGQMIDLPGLGAGLNPTVVLGTNTTVGQPLKNGLVPVSLAYTNTQVEGVPPGVASPMAKGMGSIQGFRMLVNATGGIVQIDTQSTDPSVFEATQSLADRMVTELPTFPNEPVGVGAVWTITYDMTLSGMELLTTQRVEVVAIEGHTVETKQTFTMERGEADFALPGLPTGASVGFTQFDGTGSGTSVTDLHALTTTGSNIFTLSLGMKMEGEGAPPMEMGLSMHQQTRTERLD
jgi:hypothetical protein